VKCICKSRTLENWRLPLALVRFYQQGAGAALRAARRGGRGGISRDSSPPQKRCCPRFKPGSCYGKPPCWGFPWGTYVMEHSYIGEIDGERCSQLLQLTGSFTTDLGVETVALGQLWHQEKSATRRRVSEMFLCSLPINDTSLATSMW